MDGTDHFINPKLLGWTDCFDCDKNYWSVDGADYWSVDWTDHLIMTKLLVSGWTDCWSVDGQIALSIGEWMGQTAFIMTKLLVSGWGRLLSLCLFVQCIVPWTWLGTCIIEMSLIITPPPPPPPPWRGAWHSWGYSRAQVSCKVPHAPVRC